MPKQLQLSIPKPCHEDWEKMTQAEKGRFCGACQKQVVDFTGMSDAQLVAFFKKESSGSVCGRLMQEQLDKSMDIPKKRIPWVRYFFQLTLPLFLASLKANAQKVKVAVIRTETKAPVQCKKPERPEMTMGMIARPVETVHTEKLITGVVKGVDNRAVPYASIILRDGLKVVQADSTGFFQIRIPAKKDSVVLSFSSVGYVTKDVTVETDQPFEPLVVKLELIQVEAVVVTGYQNTVSGMVMGAMVSIRKNTTKKVEPDFSLASTTVYPNPIPAGEAINIKCNKLEEDYYVFHLMTAGGQQVFQKEIWIDKDAAVLNIQLPKTAPGMYLMVMTDRRQKKRFTEKILIE